MTDKQRRQLNASLQDQRRRIVAKLYEKCANDPLRLIGALENLAVMTDFDLMAQSADARSHVSEMFDLYQAAEMDPPTLDEVEASYQRKLEREGQDGCTR